MSASGLRPGHGSVIAIDDAKVLWLCRMVLWFVRIWCGLGVCIGMK